MTTPQAPPWWERVTWVGAVACWHGLYHLIPTWVDASRAHTLATPLDRVVPFGPAWMLAYVAIYPAMIVPAVAIRSARLLRRVGLAHLFTETAAFTCFVVAPVTSLGLRPDVVPVDSFATWAVALNYRVDAPLNCFPSLHVASTTLCAIALARVSRALGLFGWVIAAAIAISTLLVKQHYVADVVFGALLAVVVARATLGNVRDTATPHDRATALRAGTVAFALVYALLVGGAYARYQADGGAVAHLSRG